MIARNEEKAARGTDQREEAMLVQIRGLWDETGHHVLQCVQISFDRGRLVLRGSVPSFYLKQLAQHTALNVPGIQEIDNQLQVEPAHAE